MPLKLASFTHAARLLEMFGVESRARGGRVELATTEYARARESHAEVMKLAADLPALRLEAMRMESERFAPRPGERD